jgi:hypothetical protein
MCFFNQRIFLCGDWIWTSFVNQCYFEYRIGKRCGIKLIHGTEYDLKKCAICSKIESKSRQLDAAVVAQRRIGNYGNVSQTLIDESRNLVIGLRDEILQLQTTQQYRRTIL